MKMKKLLVALALFASAPAFAQENSPLTVFTSANRVDSVTAYTSATFRNYNWRGVRLYIDVTVEDGASTLACKMEGKDNYTADFYDMPDASFPSITGVGVDLLTVYPGIAETGNESVSDVLPQYWRVNCLVSGTGFTFAIGGSQQI
jgi:hypothetical protein